VTRTKLSTRLRMEVLKRDGFRCVYCGATPINALLHVDHVHPVAGGGGDDPANLVTSCCDCNLGKSDIPLTERRLPALDPEAAREHAEQIAGYLDAIKDIAARREEIRDLPRAMWERLFNVGLPIGIDNATVSVISELGLECLEEAFAIIAEHPEMGSHRNQSATVARSRTRYFFGIVKRRRLTAQSARTQTAEVSFARVLRAVEEAASVLDQSSARCLLWLVARQDEIGCVLISTEDHRVFKMLDVPLYANLSTLELAGLIHSNEGGDGDDVVELPVEFRFDPDPGGWSLGPDTQRGAL